MAEICVSGNSHIWGSVICIVVLIQLPSCRCFAKTNADDLKFIYPLGCLGFAASIKYMYWYPQTSYSVCAALSRENTEGECCQFSTGHGSI